MTNQKWPVDAFYTPDAECAKNTYIDEFIKNNWLENPNASFLVACRGMGKTQLLKTKRMYYLGEIPRETIDSFNIANLALSDSASKILSIPANGKRLWLFVLAIVIAAKLDFGKDLLEQIESSGLLREGSMASILDRLKQPSKTRKDKPALNSQCGSVSNVFNLLFADQSVPPKVCSNEFWNPIAGFFYACVNQWVDKGASHAFFIDAADDNTIGAYHDIEAWKSMQLGLVDAATEISRTTQSKIKIFATIRQEVHHAIQKHDNAGVLRQRLFHLQYSKAGLRGIIQHLSDIYEGEKLEDWIGFGTIRNHSGVEEDVFDYIERHTLQRPRELVEICSRLSLNLCQTTQGDKEEERVKEFRRIVHEVAGGDIVSTIINDTRYSLSSLGDERDREVFRGLVYANILASDDLVEICMQFNKMRAKPTEVGDIEETCRRRECNTCPRKHPFCDLYRIGLLGVVDRSDGRDGVQKFLPPHEFDFVPERRVLKQESLHYLLHPAFDEYIATRDTSYWKDSKRIYRHYSGITVGNGRSWKPAYNECLNTLFYPLARGELSKEQSDEIEAQMRRLYFSDVTEKGKEEAAGTIACIMKMGQEGASKILSIFAAMADIKTLFS